MMTEEYDPLTDDLIERLRSRNGNAAGFGIGPVCDEAADALAAKDAEIARLRAENESSKIAYEQSTKACHDLTEKVIPNLRAALNKYSEDEVLCAKDAEIATLRADADTR